jgi:hypothetical protein
VLAEELGAGIERRRRFVEHDDRGSASADEEISCRSPAEKFAASRTCVNPRRS